jgi:DNA (cytosine-5)-methyltransferase 1
MVRYDGRMSATPRSPTAVDIFAGAGGLTQGLKDAGFLVLAAVEVNDTALSTYRTNHPEVAHVWRDVRELRSRELLKALQLVPGELDLLAGCPPCQGFSRIRTRNAGPSISDFRNNLVYPFLRLVRDLRPKTVMMENVPGLLKDRRMQHITAFLRHWGYFVDAGSARIQDAADFGVPQRRKRMIMMAGRSGSIAFPTPLTARKTVREAIGGLCQPAKSTDCLHNLPERRSKKVLDLIMGVPKNGGSRSDLPVDMHLACHSGFSGFNDVYGRMAWDQVAPTITSGCYHPSKGRFLHPEQDRTISLREAAILQGFPEGYVFSLEKGKMHAASMIGNALPPPLVTCHAAKLLPHLHGTHHV